MLGIEKIILQ